MFHRPTSNTSQTEPSQNEPNKEPLRMNESQVGKEADANIPSAPFGRPSNPTANAASVNPAISGGPAARPASPPSYGAYAGYGMGNIPGAAQNASQADSNARRLIIGQGITMSGEIESCDLLVVEGTVEAALKGASVLEIAETGMFYGTVEINEATIAGKFEGDLTVNGRLTVRSTGSITGAISYKELAVEAGATIDGKITPLGGVRGASSEKKSHKGKPSGFPMKDQASNANQEEDLPILQRASGQ